MALNQLKTVFFKEFTGYLNNFSVFFIWGIYIAVSLASAFYFGSYFLIDNSGLQSYFRFQPAILALIVPAVTMHLWTDEFRLGTIEFLLSQPVDYFILVLGKFFASWTFCSLMILLVLPLIMVSSFFIDINFLSLFSAFFGTLLLSGAFCAVGCMVSALSSRPVITYLVAFFALWGIISLKFEALMTWFNLPETLPELNFSALYLNFISGRVSLDAFICFFSLTILALWANTAFISGRNR